MANKRLQVSKQLEKIAKNIEVNLTKVIEDKLLETYKTNVQLSYSPRSSDGNYIPSGTFVDSVYTKVEEDSDGTTIKVMIADVPYDTPYGEGRSTVDVHTFLTEGTKGGGEYPYYGSEGQVEFARNYKTPKHYFEEHTVGQMEGFIDSLEADIKNGKYNK